MTVADGSSRTNAPTITGALHVVPMLDEVARDPDLARSLPRAALLALHARAVRALAALEGPLLDAASEPPGQGADAPGLVDAAAAAKRLAVPETWIRDMARRGKLVSVRMGHYVRFRAGDLDAFVTANATGSD